MSWNSSTHFCQWKGVSCAATHARVTALELQSQELSGSISPHIGNLSFLKVLRLYNNSFTGEIPSEIGQLGRLQILELHNNSLGGNLGFSLPNLESFNVYLNQFTGTIPATLSNASNLFQLQLQDNNFTGSVPSMAGLSMLGFFAISGNSLGSGEANDLRFLSSLTNATSLEFILIDDNNFGGSLPHDIGNLSSSMQYLIFNDNKISGNILSEIQYLVNLQMLLAYRNNLSGTIPFSVGNLKNLALLDLSHNMLSDDIPNSLESCVSLESLHLEDNLLQGIIPSALRSLRGLQELDLSANNLSGQVPVFLEQMNISKLLNLSYNNFEGEVPERGVFKNSTIISVVGNSKLCGGIVELKLPPCNSTRRSNKRLSNKWKIVISTISVLLFLACMGSCLFIFRNRKRRKQDVVSANDDLLLQLSYQRLYKATDGFASTNLIGQGSFGSVYKGVLDDKGVSINIAVKVLNLQRSGASKSFHAECEALKNIRHKNLVKIVTVCSGVDRQGNDFKAIIYELMANGSLDDWLHPVTRSLNFRQRVNIATDVAFAMDYLHNQCSIPVVHCDLKPSNVLLDEDMVAHVSDFGLARFLSPVENPSSSSIGIKGTVGYAPPEYGMGNGISMLGDVYSYGILLLEMFTGRRPTEETFKEGLSLHNIVKSALSNKQTMKVADPILLNELLMSVTAASTSASVTAQRKRERT
ncbi:Probable LRR receptor-like serine/threonine-protein kinase At3g47570 [Linum perenne]